VYLDGFSGVVPVVPTPFPGRKAGLLRNIWQERSRPAGFGGKSGIHRIFAVIKSSKVASQPFPNRVSIGTYPSRPQHIG